MLVALGGFAFRLPQLELRPLHTDEAVHAVKLGELLEHGVYTYNPLEFHGPTLVYFTWPLARAARVQNLAQFGGQSLLLVVPVIFGALLIAALLLMQDGLGWRACTIAAVLTAISPAMVYYSRYYIQEMLLAFFAFSAIGFGWRYVQATRTGAPTRTRAVYALAVGAFAGLMLATKETSLVLLTAMLASAALTRLRDRTYPHEKMDARFAAGHLLAAAFVGLLIGGLCISNFLRNPAALLEYIRGMANYASRAATGDSNTHGVQAHLQPWYFYLQRLGWFREHPAFLWSEGIILLLGLVGAGTALLRRRSSTPLVTFLAFYTLLLTIIFSALPYKTPWNAVPFLHGWILLAGIGTIQLVDALPNRSLRQAAGGLFALGCAHLAWQSYRANFVFPADTRNPYVYAGTSSDLLNLARQMENVAAVSGDRHALRIDVIAPGSDYWPLPWYLRRFPNTGYFDSIPSTLDASVVICSANLDEEVTAKLGGNYGSSYFGLRPGVLLSVHVQEDLWNALLRQRQNATLVAH
ncbi:MAG: flippase activity-associated protein Agl23 [Candidatus Sumerlaeaceae bacterium]